MTAPTPAGAAPPTPTALLVTTDAALHDDVHRLAAAAGLPVEVATDPGAALRSWVPAAVVLVGADLAATVAGAGPPPRAGVHLLTRDGVHDALFRDALILGARDVRALPEAEEWLVEMLTDAADVLLGTETVGRTVGFVAGSGGAGATTLAAAVALSAAELTATLAVDLDPCGGGLDRVVGVDGVPGLRWDGFQSDGRLGARALRDAVPRRDGLGVLTWPAGPATDVTAQTAREVLSAAQRGHGAVVLDLPRHRDLLVEETLSRCDVVVVVSGLSVPAAAATHRVVTGLTGLTREVVLVCRGSGRGLRPADLAGALGVALVAEMPDQRGLAEAVDLGVGPLRSRRGPLARTARDLAHSLMVGPVRAGRPGTAA